jgi:major intracellular serine protease
MIPVRINLPLNIRSGPGADYGKIGVAPASGKIIMMDGLKEDGNVHKGITKWYYKLNDQNKKHWYWGGRIEEDINASGSKTVVDVRKINVPKKFDRNKMSWGHQYYDLPSIWSDLGTAGRGVVVAVIDTGVDINHDDLRSQIHHHSQSFVKGVTSISDENGHGTMMSGIIAGNGTSKVYGVAPEATLLVLKGTSHMGGVNMEEFSNALNFAASRPEVDIISISYSFVESIANASPFLRNAIANCIQAKKIIVSAIGNLHKFNPDPATYPACYNKSFPETDSLLAVGAFRENLDIWSASNWSSHLRCLLPGDAIYTTSPGNGVSKINGTSPATAFAAGCLALLISYSKNNNKPIENCLPAILTSCDHIGKGIEFENASGFGLLNLKNTISKIRT